MAVEKQHSTTASHEASTAKEALQGIDCNYNVLSAVVACFNVSPLAFLSTIGAMMSHFDYMLVNIALAEIEVALCWIVASCIVRLSNRLVLLILQK